MLLWLVGEAFCISKQPFLRPIAIVTRFISLLELLAPLEKSFQLAL